MDVARWLRESARRLRLSACASVILALVGVRTAMVHARVTTLTSVQVVREGDLTVVILQADGPLPDPVAGEATDPPRLFLDFRDVVAETNGAVTSGDPLIRRVRVALYSSDPRVTRAVLDLRNNRHFVRVEHETRASGRLRILVGLPTAGPPPIPEVIPVERLVAPVEAQPPRRPSGQDDRRDPAAVPQQPARPVQAGLVPLPLSTLPLPLPDVNVPPIDASSANAAPWPRGGRDEYQGQVEVLLKRLRAVRPLLASIGLMRAETPPGLRAAVDELKGIRESLISVKPPAEWAASHGRLVQSYSLAQTATQLRLGRPDGDTLRDAASAAARAVALLDRVCAELGCEPAEAFDEVPEVGDPPRLEDFLDGVPAVRALRVDSFVQRQPGDGVPASERTVAYLSHDRKALYIVFVCGDHEPQKIRAHLTKREGIPTDDLVGVILDTFHDRRRAYQFLVNPRGIQRDAMLTEGQAEDPSFDTLWESRGQLTPTGYVVWMAIPFKSLRFASGSSETWGVGLTRRIPRTTEEVFWPFVSRRTDTIVPQLASVRGFQHLSPGRNVQLIPYGTFTNAELRQSGRTEFMAARDADAGVDAKLVVADRVTFDFAANPDFSQVESDDPQVTINQRFEVYFPEKRPFFLESAGFFQTVEPLFFSRRIVSPRWGTRVTGKLGAWNLGSLVTEDLVGATNAAADYAHVGVIRLQREIGRESAAGALLTTRQTSAGSDHLAAVDTRIRLSPRWTFQGQASGTWHDDQRSERTVGTALAAELSAVDRHWTFVNRYLDRSPEFVAPLGFIQRTDMRQAVQVTNYRWRPRSSALVGFGPGITSSMTWDYRGQPLDRVVNPHFGFEFASATQVLVSAFANRETYSGRVFDIRAAQVHFSSSWLHWLDVAAFYQVGDRINYAPAADRAPFLADARDAFARITLRPNARLMFEQTYIFARLNASGMAGGTSDDDVFTNHLARSKVSVQVTRGLSLRVIGDYGDVLAAPALTSIESRRRATADVLATYQLNPFTAVYLGYTSIFDDVGNNDLRGDRQWGAFELPIISRQLFAKLSYGMRF